MTKEPEMIQQENPKERQRCQRFFLCVRRRLLEGYRPPSIVGPSNSVTYCSDGPARFLSRVLGQRPLLRLVTAGQRAFDAWHAGYPRRVRPERRRLWCDLGLPPWDLI
jgi:hypothetical protein